MVSFLFDMSALFFSILLCVNKNVYTIGLVWFVSLASDTL